MVHIDYTQSQSACISHTATEDFSFHWLYSLNLQLS